jgi:hypothetical protein
MQIKSILKPEGSITAGIATVALVYGIYQLNLGSVNAVHATDANHPAHESSRKKAGYTSLVLVAALTLITRDGNVGTLGAGTIVFMEIDYRHAIMAHPLTGQLTPPDQSAYQPAELNLVPSPQFEEPSTGTDNYYGR